MITGTTLTAISASVRDGVPITVYVASPEGLTLGVDTIEVTLNGNGILVTATQKDANTLMFTTTPATTGNDHVFGVSVNGATPITTTVVRASMPVLAVASSTGGRTGSFSTDDTGTVSLSNGDTLWFSTVGAFDPADIVKFDVYYGSSLVSGGPTPFTRTFRETDGTYKLELGGTHVLWSGTYVRLRINGVVQPGGFHTMVNYTDVGMDYLWSRDEPQNTIGIAYQTPDLVPTKDELSTHYGDWSVWSYTLVNTTSETAMFKVGAPQDRDTGTLSNNVNNLVGWHSYRLKHNVTTGQPSSIDVYENRGLTHITVASADGVTPPVRVEFDGQSQGPHVTAIADMLLNPRPAVALEDRWVIFEMEPGARFKLNLNVPGTNALNGYWLLPIYVLDPTTLEATAGNDFYQEMYSNNEYVVAGTPSSLYAQFAGSDRTGTSAFGTLSDTAGFWEIKDDDGEYLVADALDDMKSVSYNTRVIEGSYGQSIIELDPADPTRKLTASVSYEVGMATLVQLNVNVAPIEGQLETQLQARIIISRDGFADQELGTGGPSSNITLKIDVPTKITVIMEIVPGATSVVAAEYQAMLTFGTYPY